jgi:hypothetical protein
MCTPLPAISERVCNDTDIYKERFALLPFWLPVHANPRAGSVDVFLSSMLFETLGERRWLQKRKEGKSDKSHGRVACEHLRMNSGSWRVSRQPGIGCIAFFVCMQEFLIGGCLR